MVIQANQPKKRLCLMVPVPLDEWIREEAKKAGLSICSFLTYEIMQIKAEKDKVQRKT